MSDTHGDHDWTGPQAFAGGLTAYLELMQETHDMSDAEVVQALKSELRRRGEAP